jgi:hypothetical protein
MKKEIKENKVEINYVNSFGWYVGQTEKGIEMVYSKDLEDEAFKEKRKMYGLTNIIMKLVPAPAQADAAKRELELIVEQVNNKKLEPQYENIRSRLQVDFSWNGRKKYKNFGPVLDYNLLVQLRAKGYGKT